MLEKSCHIHRNKRHRKKEKETAYSLMPHPVTVFKDFETLILFA